MYKLIAPLYFASVASAFLLGSSLVPHTGERALPKVEADRITHVLPESRELATRRTVSF